MSCRCADGDTFHSILYKTKLPFILVFNKTDVQPHQFALDWMSDFEEFQAALATHGARDSEGEPTYMNSLMNSMSLVLDEFYKNLKVKCFELFRFERDALMKGYRCPVLVCGRIERNR